jgi:hypothetical protein
VTCASVSHKRLLIRTTGAYELLRTNNALSDLEFLAQFLLGIFVIRFWFMINFGERNLSLGFYVLIIIFRIVFLQKGVFSSQVKPSLQVNFR